MEITACPVCGSKNIGIGTLGDGIISGLSSWNEVCRNCGYQGPSLVFESEAQYEKFLGALTLQKKQAEPQEKQPPEGKPEKNDAGKTTSVPEKKSYLFEFIVSVILTIIFFIILSVSDSLGLFSSMFSLNNLGAKVLSILGSFGGVFLFFFLLIVLGETFYRSIHPTKK